MSTDDERCGDWSAQHLARASDAGPVLINPVIYAELHKHRRVVGPQTE